jgi:hypothetical protein
MRPAWTYAGQSALETPHLNSVTVHVRTDILLKPFSFLADKQAEAQRSSSHESVHP